MCIQGRGKRHGALATAVRIRHDLHSRLINARARTDEVFRVVREEAMYDRPIPERHRIIFYVGHVEAFDWNLLAQRAFGLRSFQRTFDHLFAFGIDPVNGGLPSDTPEDWPSAKRSSATTDVCAKSWIARSSMPWSGRGRASAADHDARSGD